MACSPSLLLLLLLLHPLTHTSLRSLTRTRQLNLHPASGDPRLSRASTPVSSSREFARHVRLVTFLLARCEQVFTADARPPPSMQAPLHLTPSPLTSRRLPFTFSLPLVATHLSPGSGTTKCAKILLPAPPGERTGRSRSRGKLNSPWRGGNAAARERT